MKTLPKLPLLPKIAEIELQTDSMDPGDQLAILDVRAIFDL
jgi:hypothetical protein